MKFRTIAIIAAALAVLAGSCKSQYEVLLSSNDVDAKYKAAMEYFNNRKYLKSAQLFESMAILTDGTERDDSVRYYWALSNYRYKDFYTAESNFAKFIEKYPQSPFTPDARFLRLDCLYRATLRRPDAHPLLPRLHHGVCHGISGRRSAPGSLPGDDQDPEGTAGPQGVRERPPLL